MMQPQEVRLLTPPPPPPTPSSHELTLEQLRDAIIQCLLQGSAGHYRIGRLYNHIVLCRRAVDEGYPTTREYFRRHVRVLSHASLTMFGAVVRRFDEPVCVKYGAVSLGALLRYAELGPINWREWREPGGTPIEIPRKGGLTLTKPFADCTLEDLGQAVRARQEQRRLLRRSQPES